MQVLSFLEKNHPANFQACMFDSGKICSCHGKIYNPYFTLLKVEFHNIFKKCQKYMITFRKEPSCKISKFVGLIVCEISRCHSKTFNLFSPLLRFEFPRKCLILSMPGVIHPKFQAKQLLSRCCMSECESVN